MAVKLIETRTFLGWACDMPGCPNEIVASRPIEGWHSPAEKAFGQSALAKGWIVRCVRSRRYYCPEHRDNGMAPIVRRFGFREEAYFESDPSWEAHRD